MAVIGEPRTFHKKFKFIVEIDSVAHAGFNKCSELSAEIAKVEYSEGGSVIPDKSPGRISFADITLERGQVTKDSDMLNWFEQVLDASTNAGQVDPTYKRNLDIVQQDRDGNTLVRWRVTGAWPTKYVAGDWDNDADENVIEKVTLTYDFFKKVT